MIPKNDDAAHAFPFGSSRLIFMLILWTLLHAGCAVWPAPTRSVHVGQTGLLGSCADFFASLDGRVATAGAVDSGYSRVERHPYLRTDRFIASFRDEVDYNHAFAAWVDHMQALDQSARRFELANLSDTDIAALGSTDGRDALHRKVRECGNLLKNAELLGADKKVRRPVVVSVDDEYIPLRQVLGLYPLTSLFVSRGVEKWHAEARERFSTQTPTGLRPMRYVPACKPDTEIADRIIQGAKHDALGIPTFSAEDRHALFQAHAPIWEIQTRSDADRIGSPAWNKKGRIHVDTLRPRTYTLLSFTRFGPTILTQLNYIIWFPSRPSDGVLDIYAGLIDGLNYRVTLDGNGHPILYETMHNCGCYYKAYPTSRLRVRETMDYKEAPLILKAPEMRPASEMMVVGMEHQTHYVRTLYATSREFEASPRLTSGDAPVSAAQSGTVAYTFDDYGELKQLSYVDGQQRSMFNRYGLVPGSERLERFILWPTGVLSPGAMRQWGRHAVAFVGERHFDDPFYLDKMFEPMP